MQVSPPWLLLATAGNKQAVLATHKQHMPPVKLNDLCEIPRSARICTTVLFQRQVLQLVVKCQSWSKSILEHRPSRIVEQKEQRLHGLPRSHGHTRCRCTQAISDKVRQGPCLFSRAKPRLAWQVTHQNPTLTIPRLQTSQLKQAEAAEDAAARFGDLDPVTVTRARDDDVRGLFITPAKIESTI